MPAEKRRAALEVSAALAGVSLKASREFVAAVPAAGDGVQDRRRNCHRPPANGKPAGKTRGAGSAMEPCRARSSASRG